MSDTKQQMMDRLDALKNEMDQLEMDIQSKCSVTVEETLPNMVPITDRDYDFSDTVITNQMWKFFCQETDRDFEYYDPAKANHPVVNVSWYDSKDYVKWLSEYTGEDYDLPTEDEWLHACADHIEADDSNAVFGASEVQPVKTKNANKFGLYDMRGNVWEWTNSHHRG